MPKIHLPPLPGPAPPLKVLVLGSFYNKAAGAAAREVGDWEGLNFARLVFAVKKGGIPKFGGYTRHTAGGREFTIGDRLTHADNLKASISLCLALIKDWGLKVRDLGITVSGLPIFVAVPSREAIVGVTRPSRWGPRDLAEGIAKKDLYHDLVRFTDPPPQPASEGGPRGAHTLSERMTLVRPPPKGTKSAIIVDDVLTSGGHIQAVALVLQEAGISEVAGLCIGATVQEPVADPWKPTIIDLGPYGRQD